jgi:serine/threonine-protein kinase
MASAAASDIQPRWRAPSENRLADLLAQGEGLGPHAELIEHAADCPTCRRLLLIAPAGSAGDVGAVGATTVPAGPGDRPTAEPAAGDVLDGRYRIERRLARGGMGAVYLGTHLGLGTPVAIKVILERRAAAPAERQRFLREARIAARLAGEHVVKVFDVAVDDRFGPYVVMEHLEGRDLADELRLRERLPVAETVDLALAVCAALAPAHAQQIVHRDIKPANLFLASRPGGPVVKVLDFGLAKAAAGALSQDLALTGSGALLGSPLYMAPEQAAAASDVDARADIWSLGVVLYECLSGASPFRGVHLVEVVANHQRHAGRAGVEPGARRAGRARRGDHAMPGRPRGDRWLCHEPAHASPCSRAPRPAARALIAAPSCRRVAAASRDDVAALVTPAARSSGPAAVPVAGPGRAAARARRGSRPRSTPVHPRRRPTPPSSRPAAPTWSTLAAARSRSRVRRPARAPRRRAWPHRTATTVVPLVRRRARPSRRPSTPR